MHELKIPRGRIASNSTNQSRIAIRLRHSFGKTGFGEHPLHHGISPLPIQSVRTRNTQVEEVVFTMPLLECRPSVCHNIVGVFRLRIVIGRDYENSARSHASEHVICIEPLQEAGDDKRHLQAGTTGELLA